MRTASLLHGVAAVLIASAAFAQPPDAAVENGEPVVFSGEFADPALEQVPPPDLSYEDFAGPDPVLEGAGPADRAPLTAGEQRLRELREAAAAETAEAGADPPGEFGTRSVVEVVAALCLVLGLIVVVLMLLRRIGMRTPLLAGAGLGQVIGRVYLSPKASLHFVRTGGKVLVVGVTQESVNLVETFDAAAFEELPVLPDALEQGAEAPRESAFLAQLREQSGRMQRPAPSTEPDDGDIVTLRGDIERLQRMLREATRD